MQRKPTKGQHGIITLPLSLTRGKNGKTKFNYQKLHMIKTGEPIHLCSANLARPACNAQPRATPYVAPPTEQWTVTTVTLHCIALLRLAHLILKPKINARSQESCLTIPKKDAWWTPKKMPDDPKKGPDHPKKYVRQLSSWSLLFSIADCQACLLRSQKWSKEHAWQLSGIFFKDCREHFLGWSGIFFGIVRKLFFGSQRLLFRVSTNFI